MMFTEDVLRRRFYQMVPDMAGLDIGVGGGGGGPPVGDVQLVPDGGPSSPAAGDVSPAMVPKEEPAPAAVADLSRLHRSTVVQTRDGSGDVVETTLGELADSYRHQVPVADREAFGLWQKAVGGGAEGTQAMIELLQKSAGAEFDNAAPAEAAKGGVTVGDDTLAARLATLEKQTSDMRSLMTDRVTPLVDQVDHLTRVRSVQGQLDGDKDKYPRLTSLHDAPLMVLQREAYYRKMAEGENINIDTLPPDTRTVLVRRCCQDVEAYLEGIQKQMGAVDGKPTSPAAPRSVNDQGSGNLPGTRNRPAQINLDLSDPVVNRNQNRGQDALPAQPVVPQPVGGMVGLEPAGSDDVPLTLAALREKMQRRVSTAASA